MPVHTFDGLADAAGRRDVVVLDQDPVVEPGPVVLRAAQPHGPLVEVAEPGRRLPRVEEHGWVRRLRHPPRRRRDPAHPLHQVQGQPLGDEDRPGPALDGPEHGPGLEHVAVGRRPHDVQVWVDGFKDALGDRQPGDDAVLFQ